MLEIPKIADLHQRQSYGRVDAFWEGTWAETEGKLIWIKTIYLLSSFRHNISAITQK